MLRPKVGLNCHKLRMPEVSFRGVVHPHAGRRRARSKGPVGDSSWYIVPLCDMHNVKGGSLEIGRTVLVLPQS